jgi:hypothetical protein
VARFSAANGALDSEFNGGLVMMTTPPCELPGGAAPAFALVVQTFQAAGFIYARKPVIVGTCSPSN